MAYCLPFLSNLAGSKSVSTRPIAHPTRQIPLQKLSLCQAAKMIKFPQFTVHMSLPNLPKKNQLCYDESKFTACTFKIIRSNFTLQYRSCKESQHRICNHNSFAHNFQNVQIVIKLWICRCISIYFIHN